MSFLIFHLKLSLIKILRIQNLHFILQLTRLYFLSIHKKYFKIYKIQIVLIK